MRKAYEYDTDIPEYTAVTGNRHRDRHCSAMCVKHCNIYLYML